MPSPDPRQVARDLRERFRAAELRASKRLGQHFMADLNLAAKLVALLPPPARGPVVEIGPGLGALTFLLVAAGHRVVAYELDPRLAAWLAEALAPWPAAEVRQQDFRTVDLEALAAELGAAPADRLQVIGNLPYYATSEIVLQLVAARRRLDVSVLTMQREVAERLVAAPGSRAYGALTVALALRARATLELRLPRTAFWPAPDVDSAVLRLDWQSGAERREGAEGSRVGSDGVENGGLEGRGSAAAGEAPPRDATPGDALIEAVVRAAFAQRRKRLDNSLAAALAIDRAAARAAA
ncbi:MAG: 16S rRNA (adenine(1518)-N(6)/adenine(1519)-N(6))-dimethyltransferase RsmA, partial [Candidatus Eiseniibacteriota bacterium]